MIVIFVAGARSHIEKAVYMTRALYRNSQLVFVCETSQADWISPTCSERVYVIERPFDPFGLKASLLLREFHAGPIEACVLIVGGIGFESFRFRVFALRLKTSRFVLLRASPSAPLRQMSRSVFALLAAATLILRVCRKSLGLCLTLLGKAGISIGSLDQSLAVGLAQLANVRMRLTGLQRAWRGNEIVHIIPHIGIGGVQRQLVLLLKNRSPHYNHRVIVFCSGDRFFAPELNQCGVPIYYLDSETVPGGHEFLSNRGWIQAISERLKASLPFCREIIKLTLFLRTLHPRPDIVHCWLLFANVAGSIAARLAGVPLVVTSVRNIHSWVNYNYYDPRWQRAVERATVPLANAITANAPAVATDYSTFTRAAAQKIVTIPNGVDLKAIRFLTAEERSAKRHSLGLTPEDLVVGTVSRVAKEKDFETFLRVIAIARRRLSALRCVIVGEGPLQSDIKAFASSLGLTEWIQFLGGRKDAMELIQCFDVFLLTSFIEGMPNVVMESQLLGVPVVGTRAGGTVDLIREGETGLLAPVGDAEAVARCVVRLIMDNELRDKIGRAASQQIRGKYTVEQLVMRTETVYGKLLDGAVTP